MTAVDTALADELIASQLDLMRLEAGLRARILDILTRLQRELVSLLANEDDLAEFTKVRTQALLRQVNAVVDNYYQRAQGELDLTLRGVPELISAHVATTLDTHIGVNLGASLPTATFMERLAANSLIQGGPVAEWWQRLTLDAAFRLSNAIRQGMAQGETNQQIIARVVGKSGAPGIMDIARTNAAAVVQTATMTVGNDARLETFAKNTDVIAALKWLTALDGRVCIYCAARADLTWSADAEHAPLGHALAWQNPPIHFNDRCVIVPVTKSFKELGIDAPEPKPGERASVDGPVPASTTFAQWLSRRSAEQQDEQLGPGRAQLFREGKLTLPQLLNVDGNPISIEQLRKKYAA